MVARQLVHEFLGFFSRAVAAMLDLALDFWVPDCWLLTDSVNERYGAVTMAYTFAAGFGVVRVVTCCFPHDTFRAKTLRNSLRCSTDK